MITNEQALVKSVLLHRFEEEIHHSDTFEHYGVRGMKWYQHIIDKVKNTARKVKAVYTDPQGLARGDYNEGGKKFKSPTQDTKVETRTKEQINRDDCKYALAQARENCTAERSVKNVARGTNATEEEIRKVTKEVQKRSKEFQKEFLDNDHFKRTGEKKRIPLNTETSGSVLRKASTVAEQQRMFLFKSKDPSERRKLAIDYLALSDIYAKAIEHYVKDDKNYERFDDTHMVAPMPEDADFVGFELTFALGWNYDTKQSAEAELIHSVIQHHGVRGMKWYQHLKKYYEKGKAGGDKPPKKLDQVKEKAKTKVVEATKRTVDTINKAKAKAEAVQAEHKRIRDNKKEADRMAKEEKEHIRKLHNDKAEEMTTEELRERNERMKLIKQYNDAYNAVYPNQKEANRKARRELVNTALKGLAEQAPKQVLDYAIGSTEYGKRKMQAEIRKKELEVEGKVQDNKGKELDIEKSRVNAESNRRSALQTAAKNKLNTATAKRDRHKDTLNRLTARADVLAAKGKSSFLLNRAIKKEQKLLDSLEKAIQKDDETYANKIEGIYKESIRTNLVTLSKQGVPEQEVRVDKKGWFGKEKHTYKKTYQK